MTHIPDPHPTEPPEYDDTSQVLIDIADERRRQVIEEGWTPEHDDRHSGGELAVAASCYAESSSLGRDMDLECDAQGRPHPAGWPWDARWWKPTTPRRDLIKAAALIVAEIERRDRSA